MTKSNKMRAIVTLSVLGLFLTCASLADFTLVDDTRQNAATPKASAYWDLTGTPIYIDNNWSLTESTYDWCTGGGTENDPYVIENVTLDAQDVGNCITILNSVDYFEIRNCTLFGTPYLPPYTNLEAAIALDAVDNGKITHNKFSNNNYSGIRAFYCEDITVSYNVMTNSGINCVFSIFSDRLTITENNMTYQHYGVYNLNDNYDTISNNRIFNSHAAISIRDNTFANVSNNIIRDYSSIGSNLRFCNNSIFSENQVTNGNTALIIDGHCNNVTNNFIANNTNCGMHIYEGYGSYVIGNTITNNSEGIGVYQPGSTFYLNYLNNTINVRDDTTIGEVYWDNGTIGNYYADYGGKDANDDGIGDTPYAFVGQAGSQDNFPIWWDVPVLSVNAPLEGQVFYYGPPDFNVEIEEGVANAMWYTLGTAFDKYFFASNGTIDSTAWSNLGEGSVSVKFFANDSEGFLTSEEVSVTKTFPTPPTSFILGSDAGAPDDNGDFVLTWTESTYADNYSVYQHDGYITEINGSLTLLVAETTDRSLPLSGYADGAYYFVIISHNVFGTNVSNCVRVEVEIPVSSPEPAVPSYDKWFIVAISGISLVSVAFYKRKTRIVN